MVSGANFFVGVVLVRTFGLEEYGVYVLLWAVVQFTQSIQNALLIAPMQTIAPTLITGQAAYYTATARWFVVFAAVSGLIVLIGAKFASSWLPDFWREEYALALSVWVIAMQLQDGMRRWQIAKGRAQRAFLCDVVAYPGQIAVMLWSGAAGFQLAQTILFFSALLTVSAILGGLNSALYNEEKDVRLKDVWRRNWPSSSWLTGTALLQWLSGNYVLMTAAIILGPTATGAIRAAQNLLALTHVVFQGLENIIPVRAAQHHARDGIQAMTKYLKHIGLLLIAATGLIAFIALLFSKPILSLVYGIAPKESLVAAAWYVPIYIVIAAALPVRTALRVLGNTKPIFIGFFLSALLSVILAGIATKNFGVNGVMATILGTHLLILIPQQLAYWHFTNLNNHAKSQ